MDDPGGAVATVATNGHQDNDFAFATAGVQFVEGQLVLPHDLSFSQFTRLSEFCLTLQRNVDWWCGDLILYGERRYGERSYQAFMALTGRTKKSLQNVTATAKAFPVSQRRESLSFSAHAAVVSLPPDEREEVLDFAEQQDWTVRQIREEVEVRRGELPIPTLDEAEHEHEFICRKCGEIQS